MRYKVPVAEMVGCGVDWFAFSWQHDKDLWIGGTLDAISAKLERDGFPAKPGGANGYKGTKQRGLFKGYGAQGGYCEATGQNAFSVFLALAGTPGLRCSRIDIECTIRLLEDNENLHESCLAAVKAAKAAGVAAAPEKTPIYGQEGQGWTLYLGSTKSDKRARIYDKGAQLGSEPCGRYWRFEYQLRRRYAKAVYGALSGAVGADRQAAAMVSRWIRAVGVDLDVCGNIGTPLVVGAYRATDDEASMEWLRKGVGPTVSRLAATVHKDDLARLVIGWAKDLGLVELGEMWTSA